MHPGPGSKKERVVRREKQGIHNSKILVVQVNLNYKFNF